MSGWHGTRVVLALDTTTLHQEALRWSGAPTHAAYRVRFIETFLDVGKTWYTVSRYTLLRLKRVMPRKDIYHDVVRNALIKDGWTITHDPLVLSVGRRDMYIDLGAERSIAAEKEGRYIAVEVKSFVGPSPVYDLEQAIGQYSLYRILLAQEEPRRRLYLAITERTYTGIFSEPIGQTVLAEHVMYMIIFNPSQEVVVTWIE